MLVAYCSPHVPMKSLSLVRFEFSVKEKTDIVFAGLGWITVTEPGVVAGWAPKGVDVLRRKALI